MKTSFDLPDRLLRQAKALAARQGRPLRDLVAEAIDEKLAPASSEIAEAGAAVEERQLAWLRWRARLIELPDGSLVDPEPLADDDWFSALEANRREPWPERDPPAGPATDR